MARKGRACCGCSLVLGLALAGLVASGAWFLQASQPTPVGAPIYVRFVRSARLNEALSTFEAKGVVKSVLAAKIYASLTHRPTEIQPGTYRIKPGMTLGQLFDAVRKPIRQLVRIPEGWWAARMAARLEQKEVCSAQDYIDAVQEVVEAGYKQAPGAQNLDGYLFPDTYDLPPLTPAKDIVKMQLATFEKKALPLFKNGQDIKRTLTIASMIELEAASDSERARIAGVIENRLKQNMRLELDATVLYALGEWKVLQPGVVRTVKSPYNTYLHAGLPPSPIGSPGLKSITAALHPETHRYLYYVARPNATHYFAVTYAEHLANIKKARAEWRTAGGR